jgi:hypothetical protein
MTFVVTGVEPLCPVPREFVNYGRTDSWCTTIVYNKPSHTSNFVPTLSTSFALEFSNFSARQFRHMTAACSVFVYEVLTDASLPLLLHGIVYSPVIYVSFHVFI